MQRQLTRFLLKSESMTYCDARALANLDAVLPPFADAISKYTGMVTIVTIVGPSCEDGNVIIRRLVGPAAKSNTNN